MASQVNIEAICKAVADTLRSNYGGDREFTAYWYDEPRAPANGTTVSILPGRTLYQPFGTMGPSGRADVSLIARVRSGGADRASIFHRLYAFVSHGTGQPGSIHDAVMADRTLGDVVSDCVLGDVDFGDDEDGPYLDVEIFVIAMKQGANV